MAITLGRAKVSVFRPDFRWSPFSGLRVQGLSEWQQLLPVCCFLNKVDSLDVRLKFCGNVISIVLPSSYGSFFLMCVWARRLPLTGNVYWTAFFMMTLTGMTEGQWKYVLNGWQDSLREAHGKEESGFQRVFRKDRSVG